ncbi:MAG: hypothetical protein ACI9CE_001123 [Flavobacterium sp.]
MIEYPVGNDITWLQALMGINHAEVTLFVAYMFFIFYRIRLTLFWIASGIPLMVQCINAASAVGVCTTAGDVYMINFYPLESL